MLVKLHVLANFLRFITLETKAANNWKIIYIAFPILKKVLDRKIRKTICTFLIFKNIFHNVLLTSALMYMYEDIFFYFINTFFLLQTLPSLPGRTRAWVNKPALSATLFHWTTPLVPSHPRRWSCRPVTKTPPPAPTSLWTRSAHVWGFLMELPSL